jgi:hypothetical protein
VPTNQSATGETHECLWGQASGATERWLGESRTSGSKTKGKKDKNARKNFEVRVCCDLSSLFDYY